MNAEEANISHTIKYYVTISDGGSLTYEPTSFFAADKMEAVKKAKEWAKTVDFPETAVLQITADGVGVCTLRPGEF